MYRISIVREENMENTYLNMVKIKVTFRAVLKKHIYFNQIQQLSNPNSAKISAPICIAYCLDQF